MRLVTFMHRGRTALGRVRNGEVADLSLLAPALPTTMRGLLERGADALRFAQTIVERPGTVHALSSIRLLAPIPNPSKYLAIGMNYRDHLEEALRKGMKAPESQLWFNKQVSCVSGPYDSIHLPKVSDKLDYEAELGVVIGSRCRHVPADRARNVIAGYLIANDVSVRDWQMRSPTFTLGKSFDTHGPIGPCLVTADELSDPHDLEIHLSVNREMRQHGSTRDMIYSIYEQIAYLSTVMTLEPGDILATGTPRGVGAAMEPPRYLRVGDTVRIDIDGLGYIENTVVDEP